MRRDRCWFQSGVREGIRQVPVIVRGPAVRGPCCESAGANEIIGCAVLRVERPEATVNCTSVGAEAVLKQCSGRPPMNNFQRRISSFIAISNLKAMGVSLLGDFRPHLNGFV